MYEALFGFTRRPFVPVPDLPSYFPSASAEQARTTLVRVIERGEGPALLLAGAGLGKSLMCQWLESYFATDFDVVALSAAPLCSRRALLQSLLCGLGMPYSNLDEGELRLSLLDRLQPGRGSAPKGLLLLVDEAHTLSLKLLEEIRMLSNVVRDSQPRVRVVLFGSMRLEHLFASPKLESFNQRLAARCYLAPFKNEEVSDYIRTQIRNAGGNPDQVVNADALTAAHRATEGIPRLLNQVLDHAFVLAGQSGQRKINAALIEESWADLQQLPTPWIEPKSSTFAAPSTNAIEFGSLSDETHEESEDFGMPFLGLAPIEPKNSFDMEDFLHVSTKSLKNNAINDIPVFDNPFDESIDAAETVRSLAMKFSSGQGSESKNGFGLNSTSDSMWSKTPSIPLNAILGTGATTAAPSTNVKQNRRAPDPFGTGFEDECEIRLTDRAKPASFASDFAKQPTPVAKNIPIFMHEASAPTPVIAMPQATEAPTVKSSTTSSFYGLASGGSSTTDYILGNPLAGDDHAWQADTLESLRDIAAEKRMEQELRELIDSLHTTTNCDASNATLNMPTSNRKIMFGELPLESQWEESDDFTVESIPMLSSGSLARKAKLQQPIDDSDLLIIEDDVAGEAPKASVAPKRSTTSSYAQLFSKLRS